MDPLLAIVAGMWWVVPVTVGAGTVGWLGLRGQRTAGARRLDVEAAKHDLRAAHQAVARSRAEVAVAHAELVRVQAERSARRADDRQVAAARRALHGARQAAKLSSAAVQAQRMALHAARVSAPHVGADPAEYPLAKLMAAHSAVLARWMEYETDPTLMIGFPAMSDGRSPVMAAFLRDQAQAQWLRPASASARIAPGEYVAYRDAVRSMERSFDAAEQEVRGDATGRPGIPFGAGAWIDTAQDLLANAQRVVAWSTEAMARVRRPGPPAS